MKVFLMFSFLLSSCSIWAAEFCVTTSSEFRSALTSAESNAEDDVIKMAEGTYTTGGVAFDYNANDGYDLTISGGWSEFFGNDCGQQISTNPFTTAIDGGSVSRGLSVRVGGTSVVNLSQLYFYNCFVSDPLRGGALNLSRYNNENAGQFIVENNAFINNQARYGSAISFGASDLSVLRGNLVVANHSTANYAVELVNNDAYGLQVINNTMVLNTSDGDSGGLYLYASGTSLGLVYNNIIRNNGDVDLRMPISNKFYVRNNLFGAVDTGNQVEFFDNQFLPYRFAPGILNFSPGEASPLVNNGIKPCNICIFPIPFEDNWSLTASDIAGGVRIQQGVIDIGAYESPFEPDLIFWNLFE